ncbi:hypothetical protein ATCC90586_001442 [Pythium insidiosum]|nr:hypothetical protein ATCC90586_001442 [Pythium insidiosum]
MANPVMIPGLEEAVEFIPGRLWYVPLKKAPPRVAGAHFFSIDEELVYWNFYLDFGPLNLGHTFVFSDMLNKKLASAAKTGDKIFFYSSAQGQQRANAVCILGCWAILFQGMSATKAFEPFERMRFPPFHDATPGICTFNLSILDCLKGLEKAIHCGYISTKTFDLHEYQHFERVENGDLTWVSPKFIAFAGPHNTYNRTPQGHVMLTPEHYIPYFKKKNVTLVVRLNEKQYDEKKFLSAGIDHLDLIYPDGTNAPMPVLMKFLEACEKTPGAVAVHCKAGLGRTGTCIGAYLMKHDHFSAHELIGWLRLCRPGSVIGPQQQFMESIEAKMWQLNSFSKSNSKSDLLAKTPSSGNISFSTAADGKSVASIHGIGMRSPSTLLPPATTVPSKMDKTQGDKLNDQKYMRYSRNKTSLPSGSMFCNKCTRVLVTFSNGNMSKVNLVSQDGEKFEVTAAVASVSQLVKTMTAEEQDDDEVPDVPLPNVKGPVLAKVIEFCQHHHDNPMKEIEKPLRTNDIRDAVSEWDADFVEKLDQEMLFELILAANYMDIKSLLDLTCAKVATLIKGKTPEEIRATFGITAEFTPEEEQMIREENKWCEDL